MSEQIYYNVEIKHIREEDKLALDLAVAKFCSLVFGKNKAPHDDSAADERDISGEGWRGGGRTCEEFVLDAFGDLLQNRQHLSITASFTYLEHAPTDTMTIGADGVRMTSD